MKRRFHAAGIHFAISVLILLAPLVLIICHWFPGLYFDIDGGLQAAVIVAVDHFVLGPLLTFVIFSPDMLRKRMKLDPIFIGALQMGALSVGSHVVYEQRPVAVALAKDKFFPVSASTIRQQGASVTDLRAYGGESPALVFSRPSADKEDFAQMMRLALNEGIDIMARISTFEPLVNHLSESVGMQPDLRELESENPEFACELESCLNDRNARRQDFFYKPFNGRYKRVLLVIDEKGRLAGALRSAYNS